MIDDVEHLPQWGRQVELEAWSQATGIERYKGSLNEARDRGESSEAGASSILLKRLIDPAAEAIRLFIDRGGRGGVGRRMSASTFIKGLDPEMMAFVAVRTILNMTKTESLTSVAITTARLIETEARLLDFERQHRGQLKFWLKDLESRTKSVSWKRTVLVHKMNKMGHSWSAWPDDTLLKVGVALIELVIASTNIAEVVQAKYRGKTIARLRLSDETRSWITQADNYRSLLSPWFLPTVVPPRPWSTLRGGGYWTDAFVDKLHLVKVWDDSYITQDHDLSEVYDAVNHLQNTGWAVNKRVLDVLSKVWNLGLDLPVLPPKDLLPLPAKPVDIDTNAEALSKWKRDAMMVYEKNAKLESKRLAVANTLNVANMFKDDEAIYFPYQLDFRGRMYAVPMWLNPQGPDYAKGLLTFSKGKPIGEGQGAGWLAIHGANCFGVDKVSLEDRIDWVEQHREQIGLVAGDPLSNLWWTEADKAWQFLAFCFEWHDYSQAVAAGRGQSFMSSLPVMVDGTCNGLQHYSAMLRDPVGGAATNLIPASRPSDIYGIVAERVMGRLKHDVGILPTFGGSLTASGWLAFGIDRKITKRPVMVLPYGGTQRSCRDYVRQAVLERGGHPFAPEDFEGAVTYLANVVWDSIGDVVVAAREGMDWLRKVAKLLAQGGVAPMWITPAGFPVLQRYMEMDFKQLDLKLFGKRFQPRLDQETDTLDVRRAANGLPPNFVHSMDAAALMLTVNLSAGNGVTAFAAVHDSYGTHASDMPSLAACLRYSFKDMYESTDPLALLRAWAVEQLPNVDFPPLPQKGKLDLSLVLQSDFFFA